MSRVFSDFPDRDDDRPEQAELLLPAGRREPAPAAARPGEPARAEFFRAQRRPVLPLVGLVAALATVGFFLWLGRDDAGPAPEMAGGELAPVAAAPGPEPPLPATGTAQPDAPPALDALAAATAPEPSPMPAVPSVLDERGSAPPVEAAPVAPAAATAATHARHAPARAAEAPPVTRAYAVQLLAARSEADVGRSWDRLRGSYPDLLASLTPSVTRTSRAEGEFFRLRAGPLRDRASADKLCRALSQRQQSCFVVSPGS